MTAGADLYWQRPSYGSRIMPRAAMARRGCQWRAVRFWRFDHVREGGVVVSLFGRRKTVDSTAPEEDFLLTRPAPGESVFRGANIIEDVAILRWETSYGGVGLAYSLTDGG